MRTHGVATGALILALGHAGVGWATTQLPAADPTSETRTTYLQGDVVGNTRVEIGQDGTQMTAHRYEPFGLVLPSENMPAEAPRFSGKLRDPATGLDDFGARHFAAEYGRFLATDPVAFASKHFANPQDLNLYSYGLNNPLKFGDPTGRNPRRVMVNALGGAPLAMIEQVRFAHATESETFIDARFALPLIDRNADEFEDILSEAHCLVASNPAVAKLFARNVRVLPVATVASLSVDDTEGAVSRTLPGSFELAFGQMVLVVFGHRANRNWRSSPEPEGLHLLLHELTHHLISAQYETPESVDRIIPNEIEEAAVTKYELAVVTGRRESLRTALEARYGVSDEVYGEGIDDYFQKRTGLPIRDLEQVTDELLEGLGVGY